VHFRPPARPGRAYVNQGEELGLPEHTTLPDDVRQDPTWVRSSHEHRGRDGCRVPMPWEADAPSFGFGPSDATWLPQPADWSELALDVQRGVEGSTYELYRQALRLRREQRLGLGSLEWVEDLGEDVLAFVNDSVLVLANTGSEPVALPTEAEVLQASGELAGEAGAICVPTDVTVWARVS
jgi:alpha-glucosidase